MSEKQLVHPEYISLNQQPHALQRTQNYVPETSLGSTPALWEFTPGDLVVYKVTTH